MSENPGNEDTYEDESEQIETIHQVFLISMEHLVRKLMSMEHDTEQLRRNFPLEDRERYVEIFLTSLLDVFETNPENATYEYWTPTTKKTVPVGKFSRDQLVQYLAGAVEKYQATLSGPEIEINEEDRKALAKQVVKLVLKLQLKNASQTHDPSPLISKDIKPTLPLIPLFSSTRHTDSEIMCLQHLYNQDYLISQQCARAMRVARKRAVELEIYWDTPIASILWWFYLAIGLGSLVTLASPLGEMETSKQRKRRQFRQVLQDPILRRGIERDARAEFGEDHAKVAEFMTGLDAKAAAMEGTYDEEWRRKEAVRTAWKERVQCLWGVRKLLLLLFVVSCVLLYVDRPKAGVVMQGGFILAGIFVLTYFCLPRAPEEQVKASEAEEPLLPTRTYARVV